MVRLLFFPHHDVDEPSAAAMASLTPPPLSLSTAPPATTSSASPLLIWQNVNDMYTCGQTSVNWGYSGPSAAMVLNITNIGVAQQAPPSLTTQSIGLTPVGPAAAQPTQRKRQSGYGGSYLPSVMETLTTDVDPSVGSWSWSAVDVPQGWYQVTAIVPGLSPQSSAEFFVHNGTNVACVRDFSPAPSSSSISTASSTATSAAVSASTTAPVLAGSSHHSHAGAIAGGVVGGVAFLAAVVGALLYWFCRRRPVGSRGHDQWSGFAAGATPAAMIKKARRETTDSAQDAFPKHASQSSVGHDAVHTLVGSDEDISVGHEKAVTSAPTDALEYAPPVFVPNSRAKRHSSSSFQNLRFAARGAAPDPLQRSASGSSNARRSQSYGTHGEMIPLEQTPTSIHPRRKPVPRYDGDADAEAQVGTADSSPSSHDGPLNGPASASRTTLESYHGLQHQSSFGNMRPMHVLETDMPPPRRD
ncbi:hypothetical protein FA95DRAFT_988898 [Auriscalpium vulgare]|uniref:Uncharacterized protein n=1 Tax=Auriscalpium vulgare TaxID=40419 RepID=A0ACB8RXS1_9AGAM|nr:hypothetical protein FA95DRAFT_988898 [Auriscalpium vulgare]